MFRELLELCEFEMSQLKIQWRRSVLAWISLKAAKRFTRHPPSSGAPGVSKMFWTDTLCRKLPAIKVGWHLRDGPHLYMTTTEWQRQWLIEVHGGPTTETTMSECLVEVAPLLTTRPKISNILPTFVCESLIFFRLLSHDNLEGISTIRIYYPKVTLTKHKCPVMNIF